MKKEQVIELTDQEIRQIQAGEEIEAEDYSSIIRLWKFTAELILPYEFVFRYQSINDLMVHKDPYIFQWDHKLKNYYNQHQIEIWSDEDRIYVQRNPNDFIPGKLSTYWLFDGAFSYDTTTFIDNLQ